MSKWQHAGNGGSGAVYGMGVLGGLIYTFLHLSSFSAFILGIIFSIFWPAFLVFKAFEMLKI
jgi:hypothetical protein